MLHFKLCMDWYPFLLISILCDYILGIIKLIIKFAIFITVEFLITAILSCYMSKHSFLFVLIPEISPAELFFLLFCFSFLLSLFCFNLYVSIFRLILKKAFTVIIIIFLICLFHIHFHVFFCKLLWKKTLILINYQIWRWASIPVVDVTYDHWLMINNWLIHIVCIKLFLHINTQPIVCLASHLLFELLFHTGNFSVFCLHYCLVPALYLLFYYFIVNTSRVPIYSMLKNAGPLPGTTKNLNSFCFSLHISVT